MASWIKKYGLALTMALFGKNVQAQEGLAPLPDNNVTPQTEKAIMPSTEKSGSVYVLQSRKNVLQTDSVASKYKKRPTFDLSRVDNKLCKVWLKTEEGKQALNDYYDALTSVMPEAELPVLTSDDVGALMAMCKIPAEEKVIGMFPNSTLEYDAEDLLEMKPDMTVKLDSVSKKYVKPDSWQWVDCARAVKNCMSLVGLTVKSDMEKIGSAYQLIDYFRNSENFELRKLENSEDVYEIRPGTFVVFNRGETEHGHTFLATDMDKEDEVYVDVHGKTYKYKPVGQICDKKSPNISLRRRGKKYGQAHVGATILTQIGDKTFNRELVNEAREEQISKFRSTFIAKENGVPNFEAPTPTQLLQRWTSKKAELQTENNGELSYVEHAPFRWLTKGINSCRHQYKKASRGRRQGISRTLAQVKKNCRGR